MGPRLQTPSQWIEAAYKATALTVPLPIYIEPLLRWLHVGGQGYTDASHRRRWTIEHAVSGAAYARRASSQIRCQTCAGTQTQLSDWGAMQVNVGKTIVSGVSHKQTHAPGGNTQVSIQPGRTAADWPHQSSGAPVTYQDPREPFTYLGGADHDISTGARSSVQSPRSSAKT
jgi:hypothetical protein